MRSKARRLSLEHGLDFLVVDYLQLVQGQSRSFSANRVQEISEISRSLKAMARDLNVALLACSQLSRMVENRPSHRPLLSDLRDSGSIEQDADVVMFIHREDLYTTEEEWEQQRPGSRTPGTSPTSSSPSTGTGPQAASSSPSATTWCASTRSPASPRSRQDHSFPRPLRWRGNRGTISQPW